MSETLPPSSRDPSDPKIGNKTALRKAAKHVSDLWFPSNPALQEELNFKIKKSISESKDTFSEVVDSLGKDYALYFYALKELARIVHEEEGGAVPSFSSPRELLMWAGPERLSKILAKDARGMSAHTLSGADEIKLAKIQEAMVSALASQSLAESCSLDADLAYTAGLLRQLGVTLIAWNYPLVYQKALNALVEGEPLDKSLTQLFGFSPSLLALTVAQQWGLSSSLYRSLSVEGESEIPWTESEEARVVGERLAKLCKVGEALSRANNPAGYPSAAEDWTFAQKEIVSLVGVSGMQRIQTHIHKGCEHYLSSYPQLFSQAFTIEPEAKIAEYNRGEMLRRNPILLKVQPSLRKKLVELYTKLKIGEISREVVSTLVKEILPQAGYKDGCVFTLDPASNLLIPQVGLNGAQLKDFPTVEVEKIYNPTTTHAGAYALVVRAFLQNEAVLINPEGAKTIEIAGSLGRSPHVGVLLVRMDAAAFSQGRMINLVNFDALRQALADALGLR